MKIRTKKSKGSLLENKRKEEAKLLMAQQEEANRICQEEGNLRKLEETNCLDQAGNDEPQDQEEANEMKDSEPNPNLVLAKGPLKPGDIWKFNPESQSFDLVDPSSNAPNLYRSKRKDFCIISLRSYLNPIAGKPLLTGDMEYVRLSPDALRIGEASAKKIVNSPRFKGKVLKIPGHYYVVNSVTNEKEDVTPHLQLLANLLRYKMSKFLTSGNVTLEVSRILFYLFSPLQYRSISRRSSKTPAQFMRVMS